LKFIDLFAGIGGFRFGMESAGHECVAFCEIDKFARASYKAIHNTEGELELHDITQVTDDEMRKMNFEVGVNGKKAYDVAKEYLIKNGMIKK